MTRARWLCQRNEKYKITKKYLDFLVTSTHTGAYKSSGGKKTTAYGNSTGPGEDKVRKWKGSCPALQRSLRRLLFKNCHTLLREATPSTSPRAFPTSPLLPIKNAAISAIVSDFNQYRHVQGICDHLAKIVKEMHGLDINPLTDVAICCSQTEAFAAAIFALIDPGDEVIVFDPSYETYEAGILLAGGVPVHVPLDPPQWTMDPTKFLNSFTERTKAIVLNSPHNPTGKVFTRGELEAIAGACCSRNCLAVTDEVYEHITYDNAKHISLASFSGMQERTVITSSLSKTYSVTGWRVGWAIAPAFIASAIRNIHIRTTDSAPAPFQEAALTALSSRPEYFESMRKDYESKRDYIINLLARVGLKIQFKPQGAFFLFAELPDDYPHSDVEFVKKLIVEAGVVAVPGQGFFHPNSEASNQDRNYQKRYIRFAFCKNSATLSAVAERFGKILDAGGLSVLH